MFFEKIQLIFDIKNWLWKYDFGTFWWTVIHQRIFKIESIEYVDSCAKILLFRTHHLQNSTTELTLLCTALNLSALAFPDWCRPVGAGCAGVQWQIGLSYLNQGADYGHLRTFRLSYGPDGKHLSTYLLTFWAMLTTVTKW